MSQLAANLFELQRLKSKGGGALTEHLLREVAADLISEGVAADVIAID
jgi:hypothetical protein